MDNKINKFNDGDLVGRKSSPTASTKVCGYLNGGLFIAVQELKGEVNTLMTPDVVAVELFIASEFEELFEVKA